MKFATIERFALALPEVTQAPHHHFGSWRVRGKIFVTVPPERTHLHLFPSETDRELALVMHPGVVDKLLWGGKVVGLRLDLAAATPAVGKALVAQAWRHKAPKTLAGAAAGPAKGRGRGGAAG